MNKPLWRVEIEFREGVDLVTLVRMLLDKGKTVEEVAEVLGVNRQRLERHLNLYEGLKFVTRRELVPIRPKGE